MENDEFIFEELELLNMHLAITHLNLASIHGAEGRIDAAILEYTKALEFDPNLYTVYLNRGKLYWRKGEHQRALEDFSRAIRLEPEVAAPYVWRGDILSAQGDLDAAREDYQRALELAPSNDEVLKRLRQIDRDQGKDKGRG